MLTTLVAAFVATRLTWLTHHAASSVYWEESYRWMAAQEILAGPVQPLMEYQADHYQGGSLFMILAVAALLKVFGESVFVMKTSAVLFSTVTLTLVYTLTRKVFDRTAAIVAGLAYLAGPPLVAYWGLTVMGSHGESVAFSLAQLLIFLSILSGHRRTSGAWLALGLVSGIGIWFCYTSGLTLLACAITWLLLEGFPDRDELAWAVLGGLVGLAPWFAYNLAHDFAGVGRIFELFGYGNPIDPWIEQTRLEKLTNFVARDWPDGVMLPFGSEFTDTLSRWLKLAFLVPFCAGVVASAARAITAAKAGGLFGSAAWLTPAVQRARLELVFTVYTLVFFAFFLGSSFTIVPIAEAVTYRLFVVPAALLLIPAAVTASQMFKMARPVSIFAMVLCAAALTASASATQALATRPMGTRGEIKTSRGYVVRGRLLHRKYESDLRRCFAEARLTTDPYHRHKVFQGIGWGTEFRFESDGDLGPIRIRLDSLPTQDRMSFLTGAWGWTGIRLDDVKARADAGRKLESDDRLVQRLMRLKTYGGEQWGQIPLATRQRFRNQAEE